jgi:hypothetical protein
MKRSTAGKRTPAKSQQAIHRIYTEKKNSRLIVKLLSQQFQSFTIHPTLGYYRGAREESIAIEMVGASAGAVRKVAEAIQKMNGQKSVLVLRFLAETESIRW